MRHLVPSVGLLLLLLGAGPASAAPRLEFQVVTTDGAGTEVSSEAVSVVLGRGFVVQQSAAATTTWDAQTQAITRVDHALRRWQRTSIHAEVALREAEQANRRMLGGLVRATHADVPGYTDAELEAAFGVPLEGAAVALSELAIPGGATWWSRPDGVPFAGLVPGSKRIPRGVRPAWALFVAHAFHIHPQVRTAVMETDRFPESLTLRWTPDDEERIETWTLVETGGAPGRLPTPPADYTEQLADRPDVQELVALVRAGPILSQDDALASVRQRIAASLARERGFDGFLAGLEYSIQRSGLPSAELAPVATAAASDNRLDLLMSSLSADSPQEAELALRALERIKDEVQPHGRVVDVFRANHLVALGRRDEGYTVLRGYLRQQPLSAGPLHDLGLILSSLYEMGDAWRCFELARTVDPQQPLVLDIDTYEGALQKRYPWFY